MIIRRYVRVGLCLSAVAFAGGCTSPDLRLVSKPAMQFGETRAYATASRLAPQLEPGRMTTGGAQASVCTFCR
ncbi:MAG TPA: hypothetical protein VJ063_07295 [Verrucomicrobiae bacterium]|nr:hypothetical protein [Verrucomicrobiae bacterium]